MAIQSTSMSCGELALDLQHSNPSMSLRFCSVSQPWMRQLLSQNPHVHDKVKVPREFMCVSLEAPHTRV